MTITLSGGPFEVVVAPERGADIVQVTDLVSGIPLLAVSPTGRIRRAPSGADSQAQWLAGYPGGWQLLVPNAGPERVHDGVTQGFHGEAALADWSVLAREEGSMELETRLATAPLRLHRRIATDGDGLTVTDAFRNLSPDPVQLRIVQHPAFGAPFLDEHSYVTVAAATLVADADAPGSLAAAGALGAPADVLGPRAEEGRIRLPGPGARQSLFAAFTDLTEPAAEFHSPTHGFGVRLTWDANVLPHAWFWIEANAGEGWPWFRRLHAAAIEPANVLPGTGVTCDGRLRGGPGTTLEPDEAVTTTTRLTRVASTSF